MTDKELLEYAAKAAGINGGNNAMIIKIDIDDGIENKHAASLSASIINMMDSKISVIYDKYIGAKAKITHISKAGNIFIHVSKVDEKMPANNITAG